MDKDILFKIHKSYRWVVAMCDEELIGKVFSEGMKQLDLSGNFFKGELTDRKKLKLEIFRCVREDATFNIVGEKSVEVAKKLGLVKDEGILRIDNIPFVLVLL
jgi:uncharacterized protein